MPHRNSFGDRKINFGDRVRIATTKHTQGLGLAGSEGTVLGQTIPSSSEVTDIIGDSLEDYAVNVLVDKAGKGCWFREDLLEYVGPAEMTIEIDGKVFPISAASLGMGGRREQSKSWWQRLQSLFKGRK